MKNSAPFSQWHGVSQDKIRRGHERFDRAQHSGPGGLIDVDRIHLRGRNTYHSPGDGFGTNLFREGFPLLRRQLLGIVQAGDQVRRIENHRSGIDRPDQGSSTGFITTGNDLMTLGHGQSFIFKVALDGGGLA